ncbi:uncharacterized protein LOC107480730 [Arachis duranensis]|uniref:Uncharacterized protein LOC107480730 n=1 Tax=Arachis duranensis TaxID=130453 RepID=A0A6P4CS02_ARADU|nr:uncharacterized protein LOC107480730 [Arachis duranensis]
MKKKKKIEPYQEEQQHQHHKQEQKGLEILKAVAQAWYSHSGSSKPMSEFDARRRNFKVKPSRFKLEEMRDTGSSSFSSPCYWNFQQSLWDSYELVTVSRRIETGLDLDNNPFDDLCGLIRSQRRRKPESKNSLRNLFSHFSSRRFNAAKIPQENDT